MIERDLRSEGGRGTSVSAEKDLAKTLCDRAPCYTTTIQQHNTFPAKTCCATGGVTVNRKGNEKKYEATEKEGKKGRNGNDSKMF